MFYNGNIALSLEDDVYDKNGVNKIALKMITQTREENTIYGEVSDTTKYGFDRVIMYANGFEVTNTLPPVFDKVCWNLDTDNHKLSMNWYCDDRVILYNGNYE